jgi:orotate phosphoribosyltransferase
VFCLPLFVASPRYNRKEAKDHGEGGAFVGADLRGKRVLLIDDVITAGTAIRESVAMLSPLGATVSCVVVALDRQEVTDPDVPMSAIEQLSAESGVRVVSVVRAGLARRVCCCSCVPAALFFFFFFPCDAESGPRRERW